MEKFTLLADRRSGTTLVIDCFTSHPEIACAKRAFGQGGGIKNPTKNHHSSDFFLYRTNSVKNCCSYYLQRKQLLENFLDEKIFTAKPEVKASGFRLIYDMVGAFPELPDIIREEKLKVVHLIRENILKTYISSVTAKMHKMHHPRKGDRVRNVKVHLDPGKVLRQLEVRSQRIEKMRNMFSGSLYIETTYENFSANRDAETARILPFLGIDEVRPLHSNLAKINPDSLEDLIENITEIQDTLASTPYEKYLYN